MPTTVLCRRKALGNSPAQFREERTINTTIPQFVSEQKGHNFVRREAPTV
uniref:Uncharacterized protein n=1 Tax=Arundo donax TaxID=35708 RepID=A0A0A9FJ34_ARUDO